MLDGLEAQLAEASLGSELVLEMRLVAEEVLTNIVKYASASTMSLTLELEQDLVRLELRDDGRVFDPLEAAEPTLDEALRIRKLGGLGIHLIRSLTDEVSYVREGSWNVLRLMKKRPPQV